MAHTHSHGCGTAASRTQHAYTLARHEAQLQKPKHHLPIRRFCRDPDIGYQGGAPFTQVMEREWRLRNRFHGCGKDASPVRGGEYPDHGIERSVPSAFRILGT
jgi:hypothetical protein